MKKYQLEYGILGLVVGLILAALAGFGLMDQTKKSQRDETAPFVFIGVSIVFCISGAAIGSKTGRAIYIEKRLGIDKLQEDGYNKNGRYWVGITVWTNKRVSKTYTLMTAKSNRKNLVTVLNGRPIILHDCESASQTTVPKYHNIAKQKVWSVLKMSFQELPINMEELFSTIT